MRRGYSRSLEDEDGSFPVLGHNGGHRRQRQRRQRSQRRLLVPNPFKCASPGCSNSNSSNSPHRFDSTHQGNVRERRYIPPSEDVLVNSFHSKEPTATTTTTTTTTPVTPSTQASSDTYLYDGEFRDGNNDDDDDDDSTDNDTIKTENAPESPKAVIVVPDQLLVPTPRTPMASTTETSLVQGSDDTEKTPDATTMETENVDATMGTEIVDTTEHMDATKEIPDPVTALGPLEQGEPSPSTTTTTDNETKDTQQDGKDHERNKDGALDELVLQERVEQDDKDGETRGVEAPGEDAPVELLEQETTMETDDQVVGERGTPVQELLGRLDRLNTILTTEETKAQERLDSQLGEGSVKKLDEENSRSRPSPDASSYTTFSSFTLADVATETGSFQQPPPPPPRSDSKPVTRHPFFWRSHPSVTHTFYGQPAARQTRMALLRRGKATAKKPPRAKKPPKQPTAKEQQQKPSLTSAYLQQAKVDFPALPEDATTLERSLQNGYISGSDESHNWVEGSNWLAVPSVTEDEDSSINL